LAGRKRDMEGRRRVMWDVCRGRDRPWPWVVRVATGQLIAHVEGAYIVSSLNIFLVLRLSIRLL
jgi:hypothetical protein